MEYGSPAINGCSVVSFSRMSSRCRKCDYRDYCESKRRESVAAIIPDLRPDTKIDEFVTAVTSLAKLGSTTADVSEAINRTMRCIYRGKEEGR